jgi:hypothetical protein
MDCSRNRSGVGSTQKAPLSYELAFSNYGGDTADAYVAILSQRCRKPVNDCVAAGRIRTSQIKVPLFTLDHHRHQRMTR